MEKVILGASDPEMSAVEALFVAAGFAVIYAALAGVRVSPRDAYAAGGVIDPEGAPAALPASAVLVECSVAGVEPVVRIDHHNPGDCGYGRGPDEAIAASSLGQVIALLAARGALPRDWRRQTRPVRRQSVVTCPRVVAGAAQLQLRAGYWCAQEPGRRALVAVEIPTALVLTAAADHALGAALAGQVPGVDADELLAQRTAERGAWLARGPGQGRDEPRRDVAHAYFGRTPEALDRGEVGEGDPAGNVGADRDHCADDCPRGAHVAHVADPEGAPSRWAAAVTTAIAQTRGLLAAQPVVALGGCEVLDLRSVGTLPELPTALGLEGKCALYQMPGRNPSDPVKLGVIGGGLGTAPGPEPVAAFLAAAKSGEVLGTKVTGAYGDPARGYAGAYIVP